MERTDRRTFAIRGMDCAEETAALRRTVGKLPGVSGLDFNLIEGTMAVAAAETLGDEAILSAVRQAGLEARRAGGNASAAEFTLWQRHGRAILCAGSAAFLLAGMLAHGILHGGGALHVLTERGDEVHSMPPPVVLLYLAALVAGGWFIAPKAVKSARHLRPDMNLLMTVAVMGALAIGEWFEAATVAFLFSLAQVLESWSVGRARRAIKALVALTPQSARYLCPHHGEVLERPVADVPLDVTALVRPGERVPLDGVVLEGETTVNQAPITGESRPVPKRPGDTVYAGTINNDGAFSFRVSKGARDTTLSRIMRMVEEAQARRAPAEQWINRFAARYTPAMMFLAVAVAVLPPLAQGGGWSHWFYQALTLLVIACPCALVISTPVGIVAGLSSAARHGVLIKGGAFLEMASRLRVVALDKTGTLTVGEPDVQRLLPLDGHSEEELLERAVALETESEHPMARAIRRLAAGRGISAAPARNVTAIKGKGAEGYIDGRLFWVGNHRLAHDRGVRDSEICGILDELEDAGHSVVVVGNDRHVCGVISVADGLRPQARETVAALKACGVAHTVVLTGDNEGTARAVAVAAGVDEYRAEQMPEDKMAAVGEIAGRMGRIAFVGDGVNDAPAMAAASLGIAMGAAGTDVAIETADIALMTDDLTRLPWLIRHARRAMGIIRANVVFALGLKAVFIVLALAGLATLWMAIAADLGASLLVIFNSLRLLGDVPKAVPGAG
jgi:Cd2+/Zn2+-exporting ATPase